MPVPRAPLRALTTAPTRRAVTTLNPPFRNVNHGPGLQPQTQIATTFPPPLPLPLPLPLPPSQICTSLIDGPLLVPGCDLLGRPVGGLPLPVQIPASAATVIPVPVINIDIDDDYDEEEGEEEHDDNNDDEGKFEEDVQGAILHNPQEQSVGMTEMRKPWPFRLPEAMRPKRGTRVFEMYCGGVGGDGKEEGSRGKVGWLQGLFYGVEGGVLDGVVSLVEKGKKNEEGNRGEEERFEKKARRGVLEEHLSK